MYMSQTDSSGGNLSQDKKRTSQKEAGNSKKKSKAEKWPKMHESIFAQYGKDWCSADFRTPEMLQEFPGLHDLSDREADIIKFFGYDKLEDAKQFVVDTNKNLSWLGNADRKEGVSTCVSTSSRLFAVHRRRMFMGIECLRLHLAGPNKQTKFEVSNFCLHSKAHSLQSLDLEVCMLRFLLTGMSKV